MCNEKKSLIPKLRFPEFRDAPRWKEEPFRDLYEFKPTNTLSRDKLNYESGTVRNIHYGDIHTRFRTLFDVQREVVPYVTNGSADDFGDDMFCSEGDLVFADASEDLHDVGKSIEVVALHGERVVSGTHTILATRKDTQPIVRFGGYLFRSERMRQQIRREAQGSKVYGISPSRLASINVCFPARAEQGKIAACLTSLDELIAAEGAKLEALRAHKKGLMQQVFPRQGEFSPRLRFPEFRYSGKWKEQRLDDIAYFQAGGTPSKRNPAYWNGTIPWVSAKDMKQFVLDDTEDHITDSAVEDGAKLVPAGTVLMLTRGMTLLKDIPICIVARSMAFNQDVRALRPRNGFYGRFLAYMLVGNKMRIRSLVDVAGHGTGRLNTDRLKALELLFPESAEQQRIADFLSALDALIATQSRKLDSLRVHKKGLMQQLFPSPERG